MSKLKTAIFVCISLVSMLMLTTIAMYRIRHTKKNIELFSEITPDVKNTFTIEVLNYSETTPDCQYIHSYSQEHYVANYLSHWQKLWHHVHSNASKKSVKVNVANFKTLHAITQSVVNSFRSKTLNASIQLQQLEADAQDYLNEHTPAIFKSSTKSQQKDMFNKLFDYWMYMEDAQCGMLTTPVN